MENTIQLTPKKRKYSEYKTGLTPLPDKPQLSR